jgi:hypothetical protein
VPTYTSYIRDVACGDDDDVYLKKDYNEVVTKSNPKQKCRPAKGISKRVNIQRVKDTNITE